MDEIPTIYVDSNEWKNHHFLNSAMKSQIIDDIRYEKANLCCDYRIGDLHIERKTVNDLLSSFHDGRLFDQIKNHNDNLYL